MTMITADILRMKIRYGLVVWAAVWILAPVAFVAAATSSVPSVIQAGFAVWAKGGGVDAILDSWQRGGAMEGNGKDTLQADYFKRMRRTVVNFKSFELLRSDEVGRRAEIIYLAINFERGAIYARFVLYNTEKDWVVQNMDFSSKPENIMPWLAFTAERVME